MAAVSLPGRLKLVELVEENAERHPSVAMDIATSPFSKRPLRWRTEVERSVRQSLMQTTSSCASDHLARHGSSRVADIVVVGLFLLANGAPSRLRGRLSCSTRTIAF